MNPGDRLPARVLFKGGGFVCESVHQKGFEYWSGHCVPVAPLDEIAKAGFDPVFGARPLKRAIQERIENPLAKRILEGGFAPKDVVLVDAVNGVISFGKPN